MKKIIRIILIFIIICVSSYAQQWDWTIISNTLNNQPTFSYGSGGHSLVTDNSGNIYLGGNLSDSISLGDTIIYSKVGETELLAIKYSPLGSPLWIKHTGGNDNGNHVSGIGLDDFGNTYITGITNDTCYFDTILTNSNGLNPSFFYR